MNSTRHTSISHHVTPRGRKIMTRSITKRAVAAVGAFALALVGSVAFASSAVAAVGPGNIDPDAPVSLTIHKYEQPTSGDLGPNDGTEITPPAGSNPLEGVEFTAQKVTSIDLLTNAGWTAVAGLTAADVLADPATYPLGTGIVGTTDEDGVVTLTGTDGLSIGLYLVQETDPGANPIAQAAAPFLVSIPLPSATADGSWNYNPHVYPKNALTGITKSVDDSSAYEIGDTVSWPIEAAVPVLPQGTSYTDFAIADTLDSRLGFSGVTVYLGTTELDEGTDYELTAPAAGASGYVLVNLLAPALAELDASAPTTVSVVLDTTVLSIGNGTIPNQAILFVNNPDHTSGGIPSNIPETYWGALKIVKQVAGEPTKTLSGAVFDLYTEEPGEGVTPLITGLTTNTDGVIPVDGLKEGDYWLVETTAPVGYVLNSTPIAIEIERGSVTEPNLYTVENEQVPPWELPLTGGNGTLWFGVGGVALLVIAVGAAVLVARRKNAHV